MIEIKQIENGVYANLCNMQTFEKTKEVGTKKKKLDKQKSVHTDQGAQF